MRSDKRRSKLTGRGVTGKMVTLVRARSKKYSCLIGEVNLSEVAVKAKPMPDEMLTPDGFFVSKKFFDYAAPLVGKLPEYVRLKGVIVKSRLSRK